VSHFSSSLYSFGSSVIHFNLDIHSLISINFSKLSLILRFSKKSNLYLLSSLSIHKKFHISLNSIKLALSTTFGEIDLVVSSRLIVPTTNKFLGIFSDFQINSNLSKLFINHSCSNDSILSVNNNISSLFIISVYSFIISNKCLIVSFVEKLLA
jgi:hypothetical protein